MHCPAGTDRDPSIPATPNQSGPRYSGVVLLVILVMLVVLATLTYTVTSRVASHRHRVRYLMDYTKARYARDSALRYALTAVETLDLSLISRPNEPDFSDLFAMTDDQVDQLWAKAGPAEKGPNRQSGSLSGKAKTALTKSSAKGTDANSTREGNNLNGDGLDLGSILEEEEKVVRGPYGPPWPWVAEPIEFEIGSVQIRIEIEDENAKYPLGWMLLEDPTVQRAANAGFERFCEWMNWTTVEIDTLKEQLAQVAEIKGFTVDLSKKSASPAQAVQRPDPRRTSPSRTTPSSVTRTTPTTPSLDPAILQSRDLGRLVHSSLLDKEFLSRPTIVSDKRKESLSQYMGLWGTAQVNVNTAPRHVLEAAFAFGGNGAAIAEALIRQRQIQPLKDVEELRKTVTRYADSIEKGSKYITFASTTLTIRITAISGAARLSVIASVVKEGKTVKTIGIISG